MASTSLASLAPSQNVSSLGSSRSRPGGERYIAHTRMEDDDIAKEYDIGEIVGEGSFGKVFKANHYATGTTVAIKEIVKEKVRLLYCVVSWENRVNIIIINLCMHSFMIFIEIL